MRKALAGLAVVLLLATAAAGCGQGEETGTGEFDISNIVFCSEEPEGYMEYREQPQATYRPGNTVWVYMNLSNQRYNENSDGTSEMWFTEHLTLKAPGGEVLTSAEVVNEHRNFPEEMDPEKVFLANHITTTPHLAEGKYTIEIVITDKLAEKTATASSSFTLKG